MFVKKSNKYYVTHILLVTYVLSILYTMLGYSFYCINKLNLITIISIKRQCFRVHRLVAYTLYKKPEDFK